MDVLWDYPGLWALHALSTEGIPEFMMDTIECPEGRQADLRQVDLLLRDKTVAQLLAYVRGDTDGVEDAPPPVGFEEIHRLLVELDLLDPGQQG
jgi:hypothetical protein